MNKEIMLERLSGLQDYSNDVSTAINVLLREFECLDTAIDDLKEDIEEEK